MIKLICKVAGGFMEKQKEKLKLIVLKSALEYGKKVREAGFDFETTKRQLMAVYLK